MPHATGSDRPGRLPSALTRWEITASDVHEAIFRMTAIVAVSDIDHSSAARRARCANEACTRLRERLLRQGHAGDGRQNSRCQGEFLRLRTSDTSSSSIPLFPGRHRDRLPRVIRAALPASARSDPFAVPVSPSGAAVAGRLCGGALAPHLTIDQSVHALLHFFYFPAISRCERSAFRL